MEFRSSWENLRHPCAPLFLGSTARSIFTTITKIQSRNYLFQMCFRLQPRVKHSVTAQFVCRSSCGGLGVTQKVPLRVFLKLNKRFPEHLIQELFWTCFKTSRSLRQTSESSG